MDVVPHAAPAETSAVVPILVATQTGPTVPEIVNVQTMPGAKVSADPDHSNRVPPETCAAAAVNPAGASVVDPIAPSKIAGTVSETESVVIVADPVFATMIRQVTGDPTAGDAGACCSATATAGRASTVTADGSVG